MINKLDIFFENLGVSEVNVVIEILPDDIPETDEELMVELTQAMPAEQQRIRDNARRVKVVIQANDNPGGTFEFADFVQNLYHRVVSLV